MDTQEGWIRNTGTEPIPAAGYRLDVKYRRGNIVRGAGPISGGFRWSLIGADGDIEFYRQVLETAAPDKIADDGNSRVYRGVSFDAVQSAVCGGCYFRKGGACELTTAKERGCVRDYKPPIIWVERKPRAAPEVDPHAPPDAPTLLDAAAGHMRDRAATYDQPTGERSMGRAVQALNAILGRQALTESEGWLLLQVLKDVRDRQRTVPHRDSLEDAIAYAALKAEARLAEGGAA